MAFTVLIPARLASTRLPRKVLADLGGVPMVVRVAQRAAKSHASRVVVAGDDAEIASACAFHGITCVLTSPDHASGSDRLAEACDALAIGDEEIVVNVQGDEPMIEPELIDACAALLSSRTDCVMSTAAHAIDSRADFENPNIVKVVLDASGRALYFSRAPIPWPRDDDSFQHPSQHGAAPLRHVGLYAYRARFLRRFPSMSASPLEAIERLEQLRVLWHGERIAVHVSDVRAAIGIDTPEDLARAQAVFLAEAGAGFA
ncbi:MAG: 3-deoxy-manno-octulosonate cytidylyltransferase [Caldimonas sp.]